MTAGLTIGVRGILAKEIRSRTRGVWRPMLVLTSYLAILTGVVVLVLALSMSGTGTISPSTGHWLFTAMAFGSVLLVAFIAPALTTSTISGERERLTLDLLLVNRASPLGLVIGKLAGALMWVVYLLFASFPVLGIVYLFGGVPFFDVLASLVVVGATALAYSGLGLLLSATFRRTVLASVITYAVVLITMVVLPVVSAILGFSPAFFSFYVRPSVPLLLTGQTVAGQFGWPPVTAWLTFASPVMALVSVVGGGFTASLYGSGSVASVGPFSAYSIRPGTPGPLTPEYVTSFAPWVFNAALSVAFAMLSLLLSAVALCPNRRFAIGHPFRRKTAGVR